MAFGNADGVILSHCIAAVLICVVNVILESCVMYLLNVLKKNRGQSMGLLLSFQLCLTECSICVFSVAALMVSTVVGPAGPVSRKIVKYLVVVMTTLLSTVVYLLKLFVAFNEVLKVWFNLRYHFLFLKQTLILLIKSFLRLS